MFQIRWGMTLGVTLSLFGFTARAQTWKVPPESERCPSKWGAADERGSANHMGPRSVLRAKELGHDTAGTVCASDAFFPFRDGFEVVAKAGATAVIHPGGSVRDHEVIACADEYGMAMVLTGIRHFRH